MKKERENEGRDNEREGGGGGGGGRRWWKLGEWESKGFTQT